MEKEEIKNRKYWNNLNVDYSNAWKSRAREKLSEKECAFIVNALDNRQKYYLDVGIGTGRIMACLIENTSRNASIYGVDISQQMIKVTKNRFKKIKKVKDFQIADVSTQKIPFTIKFDMITAIRIIKYSRNWQKVIRNLADAMSSKGKIVFTMTNKNSINIFGRTGVTYYRASLRELKQVLNQEKLQIVRIEGFSRLPDVLYFLSDNTFYASAIIYLEYFLNKIFGTTLFQKELFIEARKI